MSEKISVFRSSESKAEYYAAYDDMLKQWPVPYDELYVPTCFGNTHFIASGSNNSPPLILFHSAGSGAVQWYRNVAAFSQRYRTYAVDVIGEVNKSVTTRKLSKRQEFVDWMKELFDGLHIERADLVGNSFGGFLAFTAALYSPERVRKVVLISPAATFVQIWAFYWHLAYPYKIGYVLGSKPIILRNYLKR
jgi:pimeloyl-ACP methyl ester carboxylesterase